MLATMLMSCLLGSLGVQTDDGRADGRPNIVIIVSDDQGHGDVSCFGGDIPTPSIDRIAVEGARWTDWYVAAPVCTPSRYALMTGRHPQRSRGGLSGVLMILDGTHDSRGLTSEEPTFARVLGESGYSTSLIGKWHLGHGDASGWPTAQGFDSFYGARGGCIDYFRHGYGHHPDWFRNDETLNETGYSTDLLTDEAVRQIRGHDTQQPMLMVLSYNAPHYGKTRDHRVGQNEHTLLTRTHGEYEIEGENGGEPFRVSNSLQARAEDLARLDAIGFEGDEKRRHFAAMVMAMDDGIGRVLEALDDSGLADNTLVVFFADNGADETVSSAGSSGEYRGAKHSLWEGGVRVPCVMRWPGRIEAGSVVNAPASAMDLPKTLASLAGVGGEATSSFLDSLDISGLIRGNPIERAETVERLNDRPLVWALGQAGAIRLGRWKLLGESLFDLANDPSEAHDLANEHPKLAEELASRRRRVMFQYPDFDF